MIASKTEVRYLLRCIEDLHAVLSRPRRLDAPRQRRRGKARKEGTVEAWARADDNPVGGYYGLKKGLRGRFANYVPPVLEALGLAEVEHAARNNRMRAAG